MQVRLSRQELAEHIGRLVSGDRNSQHGDPHIQFAVHSMLMDVVNFATQYRQQNNLPPLNSTHRHVVTMDLMKTSRILVGNANWQDHFLDKVGYNLIGAEACSEGVVTREMPDPEPGEMTMEECLDIMATEELLDPTGTEREAHRAQTAEEMKEAGLVDPDEEDEMPDESHSPNQYSVEAEAERKRRNELARDRYYRNKNAKLAMEARVENVEAIKSPRAPVHGEDGERTEGVRWGRRRYGRPSTRSESPVGTSRRPRKPDHK